MATIIQHAVQYDERRHTGPHGKRYREPDEERHCVHHATDSATGVGGDGGDCKWQAAPLVELPAYSTLIGATFYPVNQAGSHAFPAQYKGGLFLAGHGSWHTEPDHSFFSPPRVAFVAMNGDTPATAVDWTDPTKQWVDFVSGWQSADGKSRNARATGIAVGSKGSLFVADDQNGTVYRIRPN
ncbi:MAG: hypothetical protein ABI461_13435 [Polyangiaceae bacterium]